MADIHQLLLAAFEVEYREHVLDAHGAVLHVVELDVLALEARCLKDLGFETASPEALLEAAQSYMGVYKRFGGYYPLINAATLLLLGGDRDQAQRLASQTLVEADGERILGFTAFAPEADAVMTTVQVAIDANLPFTALRDAILTHPTMSEGLAALFRAVPARS